MGSQMQPANDNDLPPDKLEDARRRAFDLLAAMSIPEVRQLVEEMEAQMHAGRDETE